MMNVLGMLDASPTTWVTVIVVLGLALRARLAVVLLTGVMIALMVAAAMLAAFGDRDPMIRKECVRDLLGLPGRVFRHHR